jgi:hypothetical protein
MKPAYIHFLGMLISFCFTTFGQHRFPAGTRFNADTLNSESPATYCWKSNALMVHSSSIAGIPELRELDASLFFRIKKISVGTSASSIGTFFQRKNSLRLMLGHRSQQIAAGLGLEMNNYYAQEYYSLWRPQLAIYSTARLLKGRLWFSMDMKNCLPTKHAFFHDALRIESSAWYSIFKYYSSGIRFLWTEGEAAQLNWKNYFRWNKNLGHFLNWHFPNQVAELGMQVGMKKSVFQVSATLFYTPGFNWSCGYMYSW